MKIIKCKWNMYFPFSRCTLLYTLSIDELFLSLKIAEILLIWRKIKWLFVTYGMFQKMSFPQSVPLLADRAVLAGPHVDNILSLSFSESSVITHKYIPLTFVHTIDLCSVYYSSKIADGEIIFPNDWLTPPLVFSV